MEIKESFQSVLSKADIKIDGSRPWDIQVNNPKLYNRILAGDSLTMGESYMDGWWGADKLDEAMYKLLSAKLYDDPEVKKIINRNILLPMIKARIINLQKGKRAYEVGKKHYDVGNDLYKGMLDKRMAYSCGYWKNAKTLDQAQEAKLDLICKKLYLKKGMTVLDIGCGWGSFAKFAAEKYGVKVVGITISKEQAKFAQENCKGLPVEIRLQDYRKVNEKFDRILSIGMFEHVGYKNYREYMEVVSRCLRDNGLTMLHTIGGNTSQKTLDPWFNKYIFPNSMLPSAKQITSAAEGLLILEDWHSFGHDYDKTLMAWHSNFLKIWPKIEDNYDERFFRMWNYYLLGSAAGFRAGMIQLWQIVLSKNGVKEGYKSIR